VETTLASLSLDEKIGQMLMPGTPVNVPVGGYHVFGGDPTSVALMINEMQRAAKVPLLIADNFEGGVGYVLFGATRLPLAMSIGATGDERLAYEAAKITAEEGRAIGVNVNFYPVADVNSNPENPIINIRSFGEDPASVSRFVRAFIRGTQENGQIATAKHFPGHGDVSSDSHVRMPVVNVSRRRLDSLELPPFRAAIEEHVGAVMSAHIWLPQIEAARNVPSTLSKNVMTRLLRDELHYEGVVFTDSMGMGGVTAKLSNAEATVRAVEAGADIILLPPNAEESLRAIKSAVESGRISAQRVEESARRILRAKARLDLENHRFVDIDQMMATVGSREHRDLAQSIADRAITLVRDDRHVLPLRPSPDLRVAQINILDSRAGWREGPVGRVVTDELPKRFPRAITVQIDDQSTASEFDVVRELAQVSDALVVNAYVRVAAYKGSIDLTRDEMALIRSLVAMNKPLVFVDYGSPFVLTHLPELPSYIVTYDTTPLAEMAAVRAITGEIPFQGKLPVNLPGLYAIGHGLGGRPSECGGLPPP